MPITGRMIHEAAGKISPNGYRTWNDVSREGRNHYNTMAGLLNEQTALDQLDRPRIVCLCGSTRFGEAFRKANFDETLAGHIVLSIGCDFKSDDALHLSQEDKERLDELHKRKIDLADEVLILNISGYVGNSTRGEIEYAQRLGKTIRWLEPQQ